MRKVATLILMVCLVCTMVVTGVSAYTSSQTLSTGSHVEISSFAETTTSGGTTRTLYNQLIPNGSGGLDLGGTSASVNYTNASLYTGWFFKVGERIYQFKSITRDVLTYKKANDGSPGTYSVIEGMEPTSYKCYTSYTLDVSTGLFTGAGTESTQSAASVGMYFSTPSGYSGSKTDYYTFKSETGTKDFIFEIWGTAYSGTNDSYGVTFKEYIYYGTKYTSNPDNCTYRWYAVEIPTTTVQLNCGDGSCAYTSITRPRDMTYETLPTPTKAHYNFKGWFTQENGSGVQVTASSSISGTTVLYAYFEPVMCTVTFDSKGGTPVEQQSVPYEQLVTLPTEPIKQFYTFRGWKKIT